MTFALKYLEKRCSRAVALGEYYALNKLTCNDKFLIKKAQPLIPFSMNDLLPLVYCI